MQATEGRKQAFFAIAFGFPRGSLIFTEKGMGRDLSHSELILHVTTECAEICFL